MASTEDDFARINILDLPDEIVQSILGYLPLQSLVACKSTCRNLAPSNVLLWKGQCETEYRWWHPRHEFESLLRKPAVAVDWEQLLRARKKSDILMSRTLESLLKTTYKRLARIEDISCFGFDARDLLLKRLAVAHSADDVLSRTYWIKEILGCMDRQTALQEWQKLKQGQPVPLERVFGALDMCVTELPAMSLDEISQHYDDLAQMFRIENPASEALPFNEKASAVVHFLRSRGFTGARSQGTYHDLQNNLMSIVLLDPDHSALPLQSVIVFCCLAQRLGLNAQPCGMPQHMRAVVLGPGVDVAYFDPFNSSNEIAINTLRDELSYMRIPLPMHNALLGAARITDMIQRAAGNVRNSLEISNKYVTVLSGSSTHPNGVVLSPHRASYTAAMIQLLFGAADEMDDHLRHMHLHGPLRSYATDFVSHFRVDAELTETFIMPLFGEAEGPERNYLEDMIATVRREDATPRPVKARKMNMSGYDSPPQYVTQSSLIKYHIGALFRHKRYHYMAAITGWDTRCNMPEQWIEQMQIDQLPQGRRQGFYHAVVEDESTRYVAEENIELMERGDAGPSEGLMRVAGRSFKRWDAEKWKFMSNITDEYPHD